MTHFEYIFVAVSIVLSFTLLRLLDALPSAFSREHGYWVHTVWVLFLLFLCAAFWWLNWSNRNLDRLDFRYFLFLLFAPSVLYITATALVSASPATVASWREHFSRARRSFFVGALVYVSAMTINSFVTFGLPFAHRIRVGQVAMVALLATGALVRSQRSHAILGGFAAAFLTLTAALTLSGLAPMSIE